MSNNWLSNLGSELSSALGSVGSAITPAALTKALKGIVASKYATVITELQGLQSNGPMAPNAQISLTTIEQQLVPLTPPAAEYGFLNGLAPLIGKSDGASIEQWQTLTADAISNLQNATS